MPEQTSTIEAKQCEQGKSWLIAINHHEARIFHSLAHGTVPLHIRPDQTEDEISHTHSFNGFSRGQEKPADHSFFNPVELALKDAGQILLFGSGTGTANEMELLFGWLRTHHPEIAQRIVGQITIDEHHQTDNQLLAKARAFFEAQTTPLPSIEIP